MSHSLVRPMAHRSGWRDQLARGLRQALRVGVARTGSRPAPVLPARPRGLLLAAILVVAAGALVLAIGPAGHEQNALPAMPGGPGVGVLQTATPAVTASSIDTLSGVAGIDPLDLVGKGVIVAALLYLTLRALRRVQSGPAGGSRRLEVIETRPLGPKASLHLVAVGERRLVVGLSPGGIVALAELDAAELAEPAGANLEPRGAALEGGLLLEAGSAQVDLRTALTGVWVAARRRLAAPTSPRLERVPVRIDVDGDDR